MKPFINVFAIICGHVYWFYIHSIFGQDHPFKFQDGLGLFKEVNIWCFELLQRCPRILDMFFISCPLDFWCCMHAYLQYDFCLCNLFKIFHSFFTIDFRFSLLHLEKRQNSKSISLFLQNFNFEFGVIRIKNVRTPNYGMMMESCFWIPV